MPRNARFGLFMLLTALGVTSASAATYVVKVKGKVQLNLLSSFNFASELAAVTVGQTVRITYALNTSAFPNSAGDGSIYLRYDNQVANVTQAMRSRVRVGQQLYNVDNSVYPRQGIAETDSSQVVVFPGTPGEMFWVQDSTVSDNFANPAVTSLRIRAAYIVASAPDGAGLVIGPVTDLNHHIDFSQAQFKQGILQDFQFGRVPGGGGFRAVNSDTVWFSVDEISIRRCEHAFYWLASGAPMPEEVECDD
jgi:hypothetical protein